MWAETLCFFGVVFILASFVLLLVQWAKWAAARRGGHSG